MRTSDPHELVNLLNDRHYERTLKDVCPFVFSSNGLNEMIFFYEWPLWSSEVDDYENEDDGECLTDIVYKLYVEHLELLAAVEPKELFFNA